jgi:hypothetical protein
MPALPLAALTALLATAAPAYAPIGATATSTFDATSVRGPQVNVSLQKDGRWRGTLHGQLVDVAVEGNVVKGNGTVLRLGEHGRVYGHFNGVTVDQRIPEQTLFTGAAASKRPPVPQMIFARLADLTQLKLAAQGEQR